MATAPQGSARLAAYAQLLRGTPLVAIGGIGAEQFAAVRATGVGSIAVVRALVNAPTQRPLPLCSRNGSVHTLNLLQQKRHNRSNRQCL